MNVKGLLHRAFQRAIFITSKNIELAVFFFFLTTSLFLGDGKQAFVDVWWALGILIMYGARYYQRGKFDLQPLPRQIGLAWTALTLYYIILTPFSDSAGYSITATIRLIEAYLAYLMFYTISSDPFDKLRVNFIKLFTKGLLFVGVVATLASFVFLLVPSWASFLPPMNLLYATYGHNHLADLLLLIFPLLIAQLQHKQSKLLWFLLIFFTVGILLTFARGAWLLLVFYLLFLAWRSKNVTVRRAGLSVAAVIVVTFLLVALRGIPTQKPSLLADGRWEYWRQAVEAIKERPLFGSGPGTFYLESKRLQAAPSSYSWFAHSFPLQITVETGMAGFSLFFILLYLVLRRVNANPLLWGTMLVFMYSFYEFTLDYISMWLLVWAALGVLIKHNVQRPTHLKTVISALIVLALFYVSGVGSLGASVLGNKTIVFFLAPYDANITKGLLGEREEGGAVVKAATPVIVNFFHKRDPEISFALAKALPDEEEGKRRYFLNSIQLDSMNTGYYKDTIEYLEKQGDKKEMVKLLVKIIKALSPSVVHDDPALLKVITEKDVVDIIFSKVGVWRQTNNPTLGLSKILYFTGLDLLTVAPDKTRLLWRLTRDLSPEWSYFHIELASLESHAFVDNAGAAVTLRDCKKHINSAKHCGMFKADSLPFVGSMTENIKLAP